MQLALVAAGGMLGSLGRWVVGVALPTSSGAFPWATLCVNVTGAFAIGVLVGDLGRRSGGHRVRSFVGVGMLGGWTTFSALAVDAVLLTSTGRGWLATGYVAATFVLGVLCVPAGVRTAHRLRAPAEPP